MDPALRNEILSILAGANDLTCVFRGMVSTDFRGS